jgi:hypothetical protein
MSAQVQVSVAMLVRAQDKADPAQAVTSLSRSSAMAASPSPSAWDDPVRTWLATIAGSSEDSKQAAAASLLLGVRIRQTTVGGDFDAQVTKSQLQTHAPTPSQGGSSTKLQKGRSGKLNHTAKIWARQGNFTRPSLRHPSPLKPSPHMRLRPMRKGRLARGSEGARKVPARGGTVLAHPTPLKSETRRSSLTPETLSTSEATKGDQAPD